EPVHRGAWDLHREAGQQRGHPGDVPVVLARLVGGPPVHVVDPCRVQPPVAGEQPGDDVGGQVVGADGGERSLDLSHRRPARIHRIDGVSSGPTTPPRPKPKGHGPPPSLLVRDYRAGVPTEGRGRAVSGPAPSGTGSAAAPAGQGPPGSPWAPTGPRTS